MRQTEPENYADPFNEELTDFGYAPGQVDRQAQEAAFDAYLEQLAEERDLEEQEEDE